MSSYQQKIVNCPDSDNSDAGRREEGDNKNRTKVKFAIGFAGAMCLLLLATLGNSGGGRQFAMHVSYMNSTFRVFFFT